MTAVLSPPTSPFKVRAGVGTAARMRRIVVGVDFRAPSLNAATWCAEQFALGAELILVHSLGLSGAPDRARLNAEDSLRAVGRALGTQHVWIAVTEGDPAERIAELAADAGADLVVVGPHGDEPGPWNELGSTAERLVRRSPVPVLLATGELRHAPRRLLVPVRAEDVTESVLGWARMLEARFDASIAIVHLEADDDCAEQSLAHDTNRWRRLAVGRRPAQVFTDIVAGEPATSILAEAKRFHSDLIVLSDGMLDALQRTPADHVVAEVIRGTSCPVLVIVDRTTH